MKHISRGLSLALIGAGLATAPLAASVTSAQAATTTAKAAQPGIVQQMKDAADGTVTVTNDAGTGKARFVRATGARADLLPGTAGNSDAKAVDKVRTYLTRFGSALGAPADQLVQTDVSKTDVGWTVRYAQRYRGIPVFGTGVKANVDSDGDLTSVDGYAVPGIDLSTDPRVSPEKAAANAVSFVKADPAKDADGKGNADTTGVEAVATDLVVYRMGFLKGEPGASVLAYAVEVSNGKNVRDQLIYDAQTGKILNRWSMMDNSLDRELQEAYVADDGGTPTDPDDDEIGFDTVWNEGDPFPGALNIDQQNLVNSSGESYWFFENAFGRDSYDGKGAKRITVNNDPRIDCPNANWNGETTNYCDGVTSDDVVAHEWGHAYTEYTSGLIYQYQSGALNESYSDVWGETLDQINQREDEGETFGAKRPDNECDPTAAPKLEMSITAPATVAGACTAAAAGFSAPFTTTPVNATVVSALDAANATGPTTTDGCTAYTNAAAVTGKWAYVDRGTCTFQAKVDIAVAAGATGIVIGNNAVGLPPSPSGTAPAGFYGVAVTQADGTRFKTAGTAQVTVKAEDISTRTASSRWLIGEKSEAFGGAIRDMWTPTCYGNPGKVTDAEYNCDPLLTDNGGVHGNSGVPNHAYALAVDGGTYNGQTITGIGLDQAAAIWWRNQTAYLVPASNFTDAADGLEQSCADLVGKPINKLTTQPNATPVAATPVTAENCAQLTKVIAAVQMRTPVTQCGYKPILDKNTPSLCGPGFTTQTLYSEDFEDGLAGWTPSQELFTYQGQKIGTFGEPWRASTTAPGKHAGGVAFGPTPDEGTCAAGDDFSSRDSIASPTLEVPTGNLRSLRLSFEHYVATEAGFDGGNVKLSVNGGAYTAIPAGAYVFNKPGKLFTLGQQSTNPLGGQDGFTGTDGGESKGSWGTSQVDLAAAGVKPGDTVQMRLDVGRDGCGGVDGWYLDNITVTVCKAAADLTAVHTPEPVAAGTASSIQVSVKRGAQTAGTAPTGTVVLRSPAGVNLGEQTLNSDGAATFALPATTPAGTSTYSVDYLGDATFAPASTTVKVTVTGAPAPTAAESRLKVNAPGSVTQGVKLKAKVKVLSSPTATGTVEILFRGRSVGEGTLDNGKVTIKVRTGDLKVGAKRTFTAVYAGSTAVKGSSTTFTVRILRRR